MVSSIIRRKCKMNNINLFYVPMNKLKTTTVGVYIHRELNKEDVSKNAILPHILKQGSKLCKTPEAVSKYLENLYGAVLKAGVVKFGDDQVLRFEAETISDKYAPNKEPLTYDLVKFILSVIFEPMTENGGFIKSVVDIEKNNLKTRILSEMNDKRTYAMHRCIEEMCKGEPYALSANGTIDEVDKLNEKNLYEYYKEAIVSSVIDIYVCGDADADKLQALIDETVANIEFKEAKITKTNLHISDAEPKNVTEKMDVTQGKLAIGFRTGILPSDKDYFALMVFNSLFGAGAHSKLFNNVREKLSLAYYASSAIVKAKGVMVVNAGIEFENYQKAYDETLVQLEEIKKGNISELEYQSSIQSIINSLTAYSDLPEQLHNFMASERVYGTNYDIDYVKNEILKVTTDDISRVAQGITLDTVYFLKGKEE